MNKRLAGTMTVVVVALAGCAGGVARQDGPAPVSEGGTGAAPSGKVAVEIGTLPRTGGFEGDAVAAPGSLPPPAPAAADANPAVLALLQDAGRYAEQGDLDRAADVLERALRIDPRNPGIWHDLGVVRYHQHDFSQAESLAERSNALAAANRSLQSRNWNLIARSRTALGDGDGAALARQRASELGYQ